MNQMLRQHHIKVQDLKDFLRGYDPSKPQTPEDWAQAESLGLTPGMIVFCLDQIAAPPGLASFSKKETDAGETYRVKDMCVVVGQDAGKVMVVNITASAYELRYLEVLMLEKARKAILDGREFMYVAVRPAQPLTGENARELEQLGNVYAQGGSRRTLAVEQSGPQEPAQALLSALGVRMPQAGTGKQVLDIGNVCHLIFAPDGKVEDKNKSLIKACLTGVLNTEPLAAGGAPSAAPQEAHLNPAVPEPQVYQEAVPAAETPQDWGEFSDAAATAAEPAFVSGQAEQEPIAEFPQTPQLAETAAHPSIQPQPPQQQSAAGLYEETGMFKKFDPGAIQPATNEIDLGQAAAAAFAATAADQPAPAPEPAPAPQSPPDLSPPDIADQFAKAFREDFERGLQANKQSTPPSASPSGENAPEQADAQGANPWQTLSNAGPNAPSLPQQLATPRSSAQPQDPGFQIETGIYQAFQAQAKPTAAPAQPAAQPPPFVQAEADSAQSQSAPPQFESAPPQFESAPPQFESAPPQFESAPPQFESAPTQFESAPPQFESAPPQFESAPPQFESAPPQFESAPPQFESAPPQFESAPPQFESAPPQFESAPPQFESATEEPAEETEAVDESSLSLFEKLTFKLAKVKQSHNDLPAAAPVGQAESLSGQESQAPQEPPFAAQPQEPSDLPSASQAFEHAAQAGWQEGMQAQSSDPASDSLARALSHLLDTQQPVLDDTENAYSSGFTPGDFAYQGMEQPPAEGYAEQFQAAAQDQMAEQPASEEQPGWEVPSDWQEAPAAGSPQAQSTSTPTGLTPEIQAEPSVPVSDWSLAEPATPSTPFGETPFGSDVQTSLPVTASFETPPTPWVPDESMPQVPEASPLAPFEVPPATPFEQPAGPPPAGQINPFSMQSEHFAQAQGAQHQISADALAAEVASFEGPESGGEGTATQAGGIPEAASMPEAAMPEHATPEAAMPEAANLPDSGAIAERQEAWQEAASESEAVGAANGQAAEEAPPQEVSIASLIQPLAETTEQETEVALLEAAQAQETAQEAPRDELVARDETEPAPPVMPETVAPVRFSAGIDNEEVTETAPPKPAPRKMPVLQEPAAVMAEMSSFERKLEQQLAKAAKKLGSRVEDIKQHLNKEIDVLLSSSEHLDKETEAQLAEVGTRVAKQLEDVAEDVRLKLSDAAANGRYTIKQLLNTSQNELEEERNLLYESLREAARQFRTETENLTRECENSLQEIIERRTDELSTQVTAMLDRLKDTGDGFVVKLQWRFERFKERMLEEADAVGSTFERTVQSMLDEIDASFERAQDKLKAGRSDFEQSISYTVSTSQLSISQKTREHLTASILPKLKERKEILRGMATEMTNQFQEESTNQVNAQMQGLEASLGAAKQQLNNLVQECLSNIDSVGRGQQAGLEEIFKETSTHLEKCTAEVTSILQNTDKQIAETELLCKKLAETSSVDADPTLTEERNSAHNRVIHLKQNATSELIAAIDSGCDKLDQTSQQVQTELSDSRTQQTQMVRQIADQGLIKMREAIQDALNAIQSAREQYME